MLFHAKNIGKKIKEMRKKQQSLFSRAVLQNLSMHLVWLHVDHFALSPLFFKKKKARNLATNMGEITCKLKWGQR